jgi:hypothetical protein
LACSCAAAPADPEDTFYQTHGYPRQHFVQVDLRALRLTGDDVDFVRRSLGTLATGGTHDDEIREALALLAILEEECRGR